MPRDRLRRAISIRPGSTERRSSPDCGSSGFASFMAGASGLEQRDHRGRGERVREHLGGAGGGQGRRGTGDEPTAPGSDRVRAGAIGSTEGMRS